MQSLLSPFFPNVLILNNGWDIANLNSEKLQALSPRADDHFSKAYFIWQPQNQSLTWGGAKRKVAALSRTHGGCHQHEQRGFRSSWGCSATGSLRATFVGTGVWLIQSSKLPFIYTYLRKLISRSICSCSPQHPWLKWPETLVFC